MAIHDCEDVAEYIAKNYPKAKQIVEAGIGAETCVFEKLKEKSFNVIALDLKSADLNVIKINIEKEHDSAAEMRKMLEVFQGAELIYAIRPNPELTEALIEIAKQVKADLLIRPFATDEKPEEMKLVNYKRARMWIIKG